MVTNMSIMVYFCPKYIENTLEPYLREWVSNATPSTAMPTMIFPFDCKLIQVTCRYLGSTAFQCSGSDTWTVRVQKVDTGGNVTLGNSTQIGIDLFEWNATLNNTFPSTIVTLATPISISAGDEIAIVGVEKTVSAQLQNDTAEAQLMLVFEYN